MASPLFAKNNERETMANVKDPELIPEFKPGEVLLIQRNVNGKNVLMSLVVGEPCSLSPHKLILTAGIQTWFESSYADGRVANQMRTIERLLAHLQEHCTDNDCPHLQLPEEKS